MPPRSRTQTDRPANLRVLLAMTIVPGVGKALQTRREVRRLADHAALLRLPRAYQIADHHHPVPTPMRTWSGSTLLSLPTASMSCQSGSHRPLSVVFMGLRITEIDEHPVAHVFRHEPSEPVTVSATHFW